MEASRMSQRQTINDISISDTTGVARRNGGGAVSLNPIRDVFVDVRDYHPLKKEKDR